MQDTISENGPPTSQTAMSAHSKDGKESVLSKRATRQQQH